MNHKLDIGVSEMSKQKREAMELAVNRTGFGRRNAPVIKPKSFKKTLWRLGSYIGKERSKLWLAFFIVLLSSIIALSIPFLTGKIVDGLNSENGEIQLNWVHFLIVALIVFYVTQAVLGFVQGYIISGVSQRIVKHLRQTLYKKLQSLPIAFFDTRSHGELMSRLTNDIDNISNTLSSSTIQLMSLIFTITGSLIMMLILSPILTIASMIIVPLVFLLTKMVTKRTRPLFRNQQRTLGQLNGHIEEHISGIMVVRAFNQEEQSIATFEKWNDELCEVGTKAAIYSGLIMPLMNVLNNLSFTLVAGVGGLLAVHGMITVGIIASFLSYSKQFGRPLNEIATTFNTLQTAVAGAERLFEILDEQEEVEDLPQAKVLQNIKGEVLFDRVSFHYDEDVAILKNVSFRIKPGTSVALVGPTGAGKTTIANLLTRFYDVSKGSILIDGVDIRNYTRDSLRMSFGIVLQDSYLFSGTIRDNLRYGKPHASDEEVQMAAIKAYAHPFIEKLPEGYDTYISKNGSNLSQGQRQLIAIARAFLADASLLILDEATSSVDTRTELHIQQGMMELMKGKTSFIIAHRLSTIRDCDLILVVNHGQIIEMGAHDTLMKENGFYANMVISQLGGNLED
jgi:ATP-binding cassette, subfamily B, multidrug efflux pump